MLLAAFEPERQSDDITLGSFKLSNFLRRAFDSLKGDTSGYPSIRQHPQLSFILQVSGFP